jgi:hypothetical protein
LPYRKAKESKSSIFILGEKFYEESINKSACFVCFYGVGATRGAGAMLLQSEV